MKLPKIAFALLLLAFFMQNAFALPALKTFPVNGSCTNSEPNIATGDVLYLKLAANKTGTVNTNISDRDINTLVDISTNSPAWNINATSAITVTNISIYITTTGASQTTIIRGSTDGSGAPSSWNQIASISEASATTAWYNVSINPAQNIKYFAVTTTFATQSLRELVVQGVPETCMYNQSYFFGDYSNYVRVFRESPRENANNPGVVYYQKNQEAQVAIYPGNMNNFGVFVNVTDNHGYFVNTTPTGSSSTVTIYRFSTGTGVAGTTAWGSTKTIAGLGTNYQYIMTQNDTDLFTWSVHLRNGGGWLMVGLSVNHLANGGNTTQVDIPGTMGFAVDASSHGGAFEETPGNPSGYGYMYLVTGNTAVHEYRYAPPVTVTVSANYTPAATLVTRPTPFNNGTGWRVLFGTTQDGHYELYHVAHDGTDTASRISNQAQNLFFITRMGGVGNYSTNAFVLYQNESFNYAIGVFCTNSSSSALGTPCACPAGYSFTGYQCVYTGNGTINTTYDRVELYVRDYCVNNYGAAFHTGEGIPTCPNNDYFNPTITRDYVQLRYLINGQDAYNATNGTAYCVGSYLLQTFNFTYKPVLNGSGVTENGFEKDVSYDLGSTNSTAFCPSFSSFLDTYCLRGKIINVYCYTGNTEFPSDDISTIHWVRGSEQNIISYSTLVGTGGVFGGGIPLTSQQVDFQTNIGYDQRRGDLACALSFGVLGADQFGGSHPMVNTRGTTSDTWRGSASNIQGSTFTVPALTIGDNRFTEVCLQFNGNDPVQSKITYDKFTAFDSCDGLNGTSALRNANFYFNGSAINSSYNNTVIATTDQPEFRVEYWYNGGSGEQQIADNSKATCSYTVTNTSSGATVTSGVLAPYANSYYWNYIRGPTDGPTGTKVWPQSPSADGKANYTITVNCVSAQCSGNPSRATNFSVINTQCTGESNACYPINRSDPASSCFDCHSISQNYVCDDGTPLSSNAYSCHFQQCVSQNDACSICAQGNHLNVGMSGALNRDHTTAVNPDLVYRVNFYNHTPSNIIRTDSVNPSCKVFIVPNGGPSLPDCQRFSLATAIPGFDQNLCGYEYAMQYDATGDQMVFTAPPGTELSPQQTHHLYAACSGDFSSTSACGYRTSFASFTVGGPGNCPNSAVNISDGGFTRDGECFENAQPWICRITDSETVTKDAASCGCPAGMTLNTTTNDCDGTAQLTTATATNLFTIPNVLIVLILSIFFGPYFYAYIRRPTQNKQHFE